MALKFTAKKKATCILRVPYRTERPVPAAASTTNMEMGRRSERVILRFAGRRLSRGSRIGVTGALPNRGGRG